MARTAGAKGLSNHKLDMIRVGIKLGLQQKGIAHLIGVTPAAVSLAKQRMKFDGTLDQIPFDSDVIKAIFEGLAENGSNK